MNTRNIETQDTGVMPAPCATDTNTPWQHFVLPPDPPATRINASLFKMGLRHFYAVVFDQKGEMTQVSRKRWAG